MSSSERDAPPPARSACPSAIEQEDRAHLRGLRDRGNRPAIARHVDERGLRRHVVVPQVVMHGLERPHALARRPRSATTELRRLSRRDASRQRNPGSGCSSARTPDRAPRRPRSSTTRSPPPAPTFAAFPRSLARHRLPAPTQRARARVERSHDAAAGSTFQLSPIDEPTMT